MVRPICHESSHFDSLYDVMSFLFIFSGRTKRPCCTSIPGTIPRGVSIRQTCVEQSDLR